MAVNVLQILRDIASCGLKRLVDPGGIDLIVLVDDPVSRAGTGGDGVREFMRKNAQPLELEERLIVIGRRRGTSTISLKS